MDLLFFCGVKAAEGIANFLGVAGKVERAPPNMGVGATLGFSGGDGGIFGEFEGFFPDAFDHIEHLAFKLESIDEDQGGASKEDAILGARGVDVGILAGRDNPHDLKMLTAEDARCIADHGGCADDKGACCAFSLGFGCFGEG